MTTSHKYKKNSDILQYPELVFRDTTQMSCCTLHTVDCTHTLISGIGLAGQVAHLGGLNASKINGHKVTRSPVFVDT